MAHDQTSAILSFCLPGLGQLHQRRMGMTVATFGVFCGLAASPSTRCFIPIWAAAVGWEALGFVPAPGEMAAVPETKRRFVFATFGILSCCLWAAMVIGNYLPVGSQLEANQLAAEMASAIRQCRGTALEWPEALTNCAGAAQVRDPYGNPFLYRRTERGFELRSAGRDGRGGTADDFIYQYR